MTAGEPALDRDREPPELSIVIPAFNEALRLPVAIAAVKRYLEAGQVRAEILIVENGSTDGTARIADEAAQADSRFRALHLPRPGKGGAVRRGVLASTGNVIAFCDADFSMPVEGLSRLRSAVTGGADVAIASREAPGAQRIGEPTRRHIMGRVFNMLVHWIAVPGVSDTQCGFKAFRREVAHGVFACQRMNGWAFDVEVLFIARRRGCSIREVPITWRYDASSRVRPVRDTIAMLRELCVIRWNAMRGLYD